jgi:penicillin-binding protein 1C
MKPAIPLRKKILRAGYRLLRFCCYAVLIFVALDCLFPVDSTLEFAPLVRTRDGNVTHAFLTRDQQWRFETRLDELTPELKEAIIFKEDRYFHHHFGINPLAVGRALIHNIFRLKRTSGASTITMQVARLQAPKRRTYFNKAIEMFRAMQLETHYSKDEILRLYLNLVPYGSNIQGVKAASLLYFNKSPDQLSLAELTALSIIPNRPNSLVIGKDNPKIVLERNKWLLRFKEAKLFPPQVIDDALKEPLDAYRHNAPDGIPQLAWRLRFNLPATLDIHATIDPGMQLKAEQIVYRYVASLKLQQVFNAAVIITDNRTHEVLTYIGSPDFDDRAHQGQVDGVKALRSPGSTLKPFLYGLAYDAGMITPQTMIADVPVNLNGYTPENYDLQFRGNVSVDEALRHSLNIPAIKVLQQFTVPHFTQKLGEAGFTSVWQQRKKVGISMILGGVTVWLQELTALFSAFANRGVYHPLRWTKGTGTDTSAGRPILSPGANYMVCKTLCELSRPDLPNGFDITRNIPRIAWKTGTSYGRKDAWSIGFNGRYTIGVWLGNFDGKGITSLSGATTATPLLFELFNAIDQNAGADWLQAPPELAARFVCKLTGMVPADGCTDQVMDYYIPGISGNERCNHQRDVWVSADERFAYCTTCLPVNGYQTKTYPNISPELAAFYDEHHISYQKIPPHNPSCSRTFDGQPPVISTLQNGMTYLIVDPEKQQLQLGCTTANDVQQVYWYINNKFLGSARRGEKMLFTPTGNVIKISCTDDKGRNTDIEVKVKFL